MKKVDQHVKQLHLNDGIVNKMDIIDTVKDLAKRWKTTSDYEKEGGPKVPGPKKAVVKKTTVVEAVPEDDLPAVNDKGEYVKPRPYKKGGSVKSSASSRADGAAIRGKTRGKIC